MCKYTVQYINYLSTGLLEKERQGLYYVQVSFGYPKYTQTLDNKYHSATREDFAIFGTLHRSQEEI